MEKLKKKSIAKWKGLNSSNVTADSISALNSETKNYEKNAEKIFKYKKTERKRDLNSLKARELEIESLTRFIRLLLM